MEMTQSLLVAFSQESGISQARFHERAMKTGFRPVSSHAIPIVHSVIMIVISVPCNLETSRSLQTACHALCRLREGRSCMCVLWRDNFKENRENCHDFIVLYCVRNWEGISVVENLVRHNNRSFRANKLVIVSPN